MGCCNGSEEENYIIAEFFIEKENINKKTQIINSFDNIQREVKKEDKEGEKYKIEGSIKQCEIKVDEELIPFSYEYAFKTSGNHTVKYTFPDPLTQTSYLFSDCSLMKKVDLSHFNTKKLTCTNYMFMSSGLESVIFFNSKIEKVTEMKGMFTSCKKMKNFSSNKLKAEMSINMDSFFSSCDELENVDLSNFKAKVISMNCMFYFCKALRNVNLSNLDSKNAIINDIFLGCYILKKEKVITKDQNILDRFEQAVGPTYFS